MRVTLVVMGVWVVLRMRRSWIVFFNFAVIAIAQSK